MGLFLFCLALQPALLAIKDKVDSLTYIDDIYLIGEKSKMVSALKTLKEYLPRLGLEVNFKKS